MGITKTTCEPRPEETLAGRWQLDSRRSSVEFRTRHFWGLVTVKGHFEEYQGRLDLSADPAIELTINAASLQTGNPKRDRHLRSPDFFDAENHAQARFISDAVVRRDDTLKVHGHLHVRDRSIPLEFDAQVRWTNDEPKIEAGTTAGHRQLGMTWNPLGMIPPSSELRVEGHLLRVEE